MSCCLIAGNLWAESFANLQHIPGSVIKVPWLDAYSTVPNLEPRWFLHAASLVHLWRR